ncbi:uncharacterized protein LOC142904303 [Nelusetta ayraudi]|uniref:uncharacterized protein LOC142904303 n=1 Tax=Nelusetta ayraudi TaxID=303726 RepID=UPI003F72898E
MAKDDELERRAIEELLKETNRARVRAETMGPTGWLKCPLRSTNKRFLLNTLRSTGLQRRPGEPSERLSPARGRQRGDSPVRNRDRSRSPASRERRSNGGRGDHRDSSSSTSRNNKDKSRDRDGQTGYRHKDKRDRGHSGDNHNTNKRQTS